MTGRSSRYVKAENGDLTYEHRSHGRSKTIEAVNIKEKTQFMDGEKLIAIISEATSAGISLHSDRRAKNTRRRIHITMEVPWSAEQLVQQLGRTHRSNQMNAPRYVIMLSNLAGENRFVAQVVQRLKNMSALTHGDCTFVGGNILRGIDERYAEDGLKLLLEKIFDGNEYSRFKEALISVGISRSTQDLGLFLNRILVFPVKMQNDVFCDLLKAVESVKSKLTKVQVNIYTVFFRLVNFTN